MFARKLAAFFCAGLLCLACAGAVTAAKDSSRQATDAAECCSESAYVTLPVIHFSSDSDSLDVVEAEKLDRLINLLIDYAEMNLLVVGHTDSQGSRAYNQALSKRRSLAVIDYLVGRGIDAGRLESSALSESRPMATNTHSGGRAENRRVIFIEQ